MREKITPWIEALAVSSAVTGKYVVIRSLKNGFIIHLLYMQEASQLPPPICSCRQSLIQLMPTLRCSAHRMNELHKS